MMPPAPQNIQFSAGIIVGLAFRAFIYYFLTIALHRFEGYGPPDPLLPLSLLITFSSPLWVPFVGGYLSSYFWRRLSAQYCFRATSIVMASLGAVLVIWACFIHSAPFVVILTFLGFLLVYLDDRMSALGMARGTRVWNERRPQLMEIPPENENVLTGGGEI